MARRRRLKIPESTNPYPVAPVVNQEEYVSGYGFGYGTKAQSLSPELRDWETGGVSFETYRMMANDPEIISNLRTLVGMVFSEGYEIAPAFKGSIVSEDKPEYAQAVILAEHCKRSLSELRKPFKKTLSSMLEGALKYGHKVAEKTWKHGEGEDADKLVLDRIAIKDYRTIDFVVDAFWNLLGFISSSASPKVGVHSVIPREKFFVLSIHEEDEDPRGISHIRPAYTAWQFKLMTWPEYYRWLCSCALPYLVGKPAEKQPGQVQKINGVSTGKQLTPTEAMRDALIELKNAGVLAVPAGSEVDQLETQGEGNGFDRALSVADSQMNKGILYQTLATSEAEFGTRAQSETHMGILDMVAADMREMVIDCVTDDIIVPMCVYNFPPEMMDYCPLFTLGDSDRRDWAEDAAAAVALEPQLTDSQWQDLTMSMGIKPAQPGEKTRGDMRQEAMAEQTAKMEKDEPKDSKA